MQLRWRFQHLPGEQTRPEQQMQPWEQEGLETFFAFASLAFFSAALVALISTGFCFGAGTFSFGLTGTFSRVADSAAAAASRCSASFNLLCVSYLVETR